jgi:hypothetical protein
LSEPIRLEVAFARGKNTVLMGLAGAIANTRW